MKVIIGYDGSPSANEALEELKRVGLPDETEALIVSVGDVWMPPPNAEISREALASRRVSTALARLQNQAERTLKETEETSAEAARRVKSNFPDWLVEPETMRGDAASALISKAAEWRADLIIVGSQNRSAIGRFFLGSVSQKVVTEASCSVRVAREGTVQIDKNAPRRVVAGIDDSDAANLIISTIAARNWTNESVLTILTVTDIFKADAVQPFSQFIGAQELQKAALEKLAATGLKILTDVREGDVRSELIAEAEKLHAECIFVGSRNIQGTLNRFMLGSVSSAVVANATCSVEVVRPRN